MCSQQGTQMKVSEIKPNVEVKSEPKDFCEQGDIEPESSESTVQDKLREQNRIRQLAFKL